MEAPSDRLKRARIARGFADAADAARAFGWNVVTYRAHESGARGIKKVAERYAKALGTTAAWLVYGQGDPPANAPAPAPQLYDPEPNAILEAGPVYLPPKTGPRDIEELGATMAGDGEDESAFEMNGQVVDLVKRPPGLLHRKDVFALRVTNVSMYPKFEDGERIYLEKRKPAIGEYIVIELHPMGEGRPGKSYIKKLLAADAAKVTVEQFNPHGVLNFRRAEIKQILRVIPTPELLGL